jgi:glycerol uptake facilitator-like aquaporin
VSPPLGRRLFAEFLGSAFLAALVIGSGIAAQRLSPGDTGLQLLYNSAATAGGLFAIILMFGPVSGGHSTRSCRTSDHHRASPAHLFAEVIATLGLLLVIFALPRTGRAVTAPAAVGAYIGAAYWFTSSTSFANPAITVGRMLSNTFAGIAPASVPAFVAAQLAGGLVAFVIIKALYPDLESRAADVVVPHTGPDPRERHA